MAESYDDLGDLEQRLRDAADAVAAARWSRHSANPLAAPLVAGAAHQALAETDYLLRLVSARQPSGQETLSSLLPSRHASPVAVFASVAATVLASLTVVVGGPLAVFAVAAVVRLWPELVPGEVAQGVVMLGVPYAVMALLLVMMRAWRGRAWPLVERLLLGGFSRASVRSGEKTQPANQGT